MKKLNFMVNKGKFEKQISLDEKELFNFYNRIVKESQLFTFTDTRLVKQATKLHKWFLMNPFYDSKCTIDSYEVNPNLNFNPSMPIKPGYFLFKSCHEKNNDTIRILYLLASSSISDKNSEPVKQMEESTLVKSKNVTVSYGAYLEDKFEVGYLFVSRIYMEKMNLRIKELQNRIRDSESNNSKGEKERIAINEEFMDILKKVGLIFINSTDEFTSDKIEAKINHIMKKDAFTSLEPSVDILEILLGIFSLNGIYSSGKLYPLILQYHQVRYFK